MPLLNFRDLGGIPAKEGRKIRSGCFYRGGPLTDLSDREKAFIDTIGLRVILDLRSDKELQRSSPEYIPVNCLYRHIGATKLLHETRRDDLDMTGATGERIEDWLKLQYRDLPFDSEAYRYLLSCLLSDDLPVYFHCSAGKDRTGVGAALLLYLLDADREEIYRDYLLSYEAMMKLNIPHTRPTLVFREWLEGTFEEIDKRYPDRDSFFAGEFAISAAQRKELIKRFTL